MTIRIVVPIKIVGPTLFLSLCAVIGASTLLAQTPDSLSIGFDEEAILESIDEQDGNAAQLAELLQSLIDNPLDINTATSEALSIIPPIGSELAHRIILYRQQNGSFKSVTDLQLVPGLSVMVLLQARPYVTIDDNPEDITDRTSRFPSAPGFREITSNMRFDLIQRLSRRLNLGRGFDDDTSRTTYAGSPQRVYTRLKGAFERRAGFNITLEKDPGEKFEWNPGNGSYAFDHSTGHVFLRDYGRLRSLIVGDYVANFGQGLGLWQGSASGKSRESTSSVVRSGPGITPYGSTDENNFFRGVGATVLITPSLSASSFYSRRSLDASVVAMQTTAGVEDETAISWLTTTGLHRTPHEISLKDALREDVIGGALEYSFTNSIFGANSYRSRFDQPIVKGKRIDEIFEFSGTDFALSSFYARAFFVDYSLFGEVARDNSGTVAAVGGFTARAGRIARAVVIARYYPRDFTSLHGHAFGERNGISANESGVYTGMQVVPSRTLRIDAYFDQFTFPWARFGVPRPSDGYEALISVQHKPRRWLSHYVQFKSKTKEAGTGFFKPNRIELDGVIEETRQSVRWHVDYEFSKRLKTRTRTEGVRFLTGDTNDEFGFLLYQDVRWVATGRITLDWRLLFFDTDSFNTRVFAYEYDLRYTFAVPAFSGQGQRAYILAGIEAIDGFLIQAKFGVTRFENEETVGSGLDETKGNTLSELRLQLFWRF
ncbi:MAG: helix-hairpin-helix domain-containing protein [Rhodothermales bacterium]|nr:helix-hairpin-helix domain-containing protein [Rhodothermales bacterium]